MSVPPRSAITLSESDSKALIREFGVPVVAERLVATAAQSGDAAESLGYPVVAKLCGDHIAHKTERGLVRLGLDTPDAVANAVAELLAAATPEDGDVSVLLAPMIRGNRELIAGMHRDAQFGPTILLGLGGIIAEAVQDVAIRLAPISDLDVMEMCEQLSSQRLLGAFRGEAAVDRDALRAVLQGLSSVALERPDVQSIDLNPLIVQPNGQIVAVDALVEILP